MDSLLSNPIILIILAVFSLGFGFVLGFVSRSFLKGSSDASSDVEKSRPKPPSRNWIEVAHLWRDRRDSRLIFQVEDQHYKRGDDLTSKERKVLLKVVMDFYRWLEPPSAIKQKPPPSTPDTSAPVNQVPLDLPQEEKVESRRGRLNPVTVFTQALEADVATSALPNQSMVVQIDAILQKKIIAANMQKWAIRLAEFPNRGMVVLVGLEQYDGIDEVPYERVRMMIRESVAEWEQRAESGDLD